MNPTKDWFSDWFNSHYYHLLYKDRNHAEAEEFIKRLFSYLSLSTEKKVLDLACGRGRHSLQVNELGYDVLGVDLSEESISFAKQFENNRLRFEIKDMRSLSHKNEFDLVLNLFTSFGYFQKEGDNVKVISSISNSLKKDGMLVLDYLNVNMVKPILPLEEVKTKSGIDFNIKKEIENGFIKKSITFTDNDIQYTYHEFVKLIDLEMFQSYFEQNGMKTQEVLGDYELNTFDVNSSDRLIMIAKKA